jgi:hypothetical protein
MKNKQAHAPEKKKDQTMKSPKSIITGSFPSLALRATVPLLAAALIATAASAREKEQADGSAGRQAQVPDTLQVRAGNVLSFRATGVGVQIYVWHVNPTNAAMSAWALKAPHAVLFHKEGKVVGIHFAGPSWEANDGSKVVGTRVDGVMVNPNAIPWLLLQGTTTTGDGIFTGTTYIQRLYTLGGLAPATPGTMDGEEALVPYSADYYFWRSSGS